MTSRPINIREISRARFDALASMSRSPAAAYVSEELAWYANEDETILGVMLRDVIDNDYVAIVMARDEGGVFRCFDSECSLPTPNEATAWLTRAMKWHTGQGVRMYAQGDYSRGVDLFTPVLAEERLHPFFVGLASNPAFLPAKEMIRAMMPAFIDIDGNFVEQFQTVGFDARLWELYLNSYLREEELFIDRPRPSPDFLVTKFGQSVAIEAVIVGRRTGSPARYFKSSDDPVRMPLPNDYTHEMPIRFGSPLFTKLRKEYWNLPHVTGKPLVFAIADFHDDQSMLWSSAALIRYLYGMDHAFHYNDAGELIIVPSAITTHQGSKTIPSGFFRQPNSEYVSAVLFSASGTISKFNRLGRQAGFADPDVTLIRIGTCHDHDPRASMPKMFRYVVDETCKETWAEGMSMFHNPRALHPVPQELFPSIAHHRLRDDGQIVSRIPEFHPYGSITWLVHARREGR